MIEKTFARMGGMAIVGVLACGLVQAQAGPAVLTIHADQPVSAVSPTLYGLMTEEINYCYDGGLYAEMVRNRTFRETGPECPTGTCWRQGTPWRRWTVDETTGPSAALPRACGWM